jgi:sensor c-di-GMP phosphodiesterase-like protein
MKRILKQRVLITIVATVVATACGLLTAYLLGRTIALRLTARGLAPDAAREIAESDLFASDAHAVLDAMKASRYPFCSEEDMGLLRNLLYHSYLLKDVGRIRDNKIACSATLAHEHLPGSELPNPVSIGTDGVKVYRDFPGFRLPNVLIVVLQDGDSYVVLNLRVNNLRESSPVHFTTTVIGPAQYQRVVRAGGPEQTSWAQLTRDGDFRIGETLYSTRCSSLKINNICITASLSVSEALQANRGELKVLVLLGGLTGALFGLMLSIFYRRNRSLDHQLLRAIRKDKLQVVYQQIVSLASGRIVGAEALARWTDEEGSAVGPDIFVKIAEEHGFVGSITRLVVRHVLRDFAATLRVLPDFRLSINVAAADLADPGFLPMLEQALKQAEVPAKSLIIEITESSTARHEMAIASILRLHQRGHSIHIDDFGTGYSSLSYLHDLAVDAIKIDRTFTRTIGTEAVTAGILPQILAMAESLNLLVIVEGIETSQQAEYFAAEAQPIFGQGWLFGRAVTVDAFHSLLAEEEIRAQAETTEHEPEYPVCIAP